MKESEVIALRRGGGTYCSFLLVRCGDEAGLIQRRRGEAGEEEGDVSAW